MKSAYDGRLSLKGRKNHGANVATEKKHGI
jgi:hypothetical protein